ncbi:hypothetical protein UlMin_039741 [Ulmus minor]
MVLNKLVSLIYNFINLKGQQRTKKAPASCELIESNVDEKIEEGLAESSLESSVGDGEYCCVCLSRLKEEEDARVLPCLHKFHNQCIESWFSACKKSCPLCRFSMEEDKLFAGQMWTDEMLIYFSSFHAAGF